MKNKLISSLIDMGICSSDSLHIIHPRTRDNNNLNVLKCAKSGLIVLEEVLINEDYYVQAEKRAALLQLKKN